MPRFHFHTEDGTFLSDEDGIELPDLDAAKVEALRVIGDTLNHDPQLYWKHQHFAVIVTDDANAQLFVINLQPDP